MATTTSQMKFIGTIPILPPKTSWKAASGWNPIEVAPCTRRTIPRQNSIAPRVTMNEGMENRSVIRPFMKPMPAPSATAGPLEALG